MIQKRIGVFETNSSSTHTLCIVTDEEMKKLQSGELFISNWGSKLYTREQAINEALTAYNRRYDDKYTRERVDAMDESELLDFLSCNEIVTFENWGSEYLDYFEESYTTDSGDKIVVFGQYGYDA